ncbi:rust resistance kinase Lr10 [Vitis vinifera]|uniref:rust resistance kinase Lr10 n=1 Tax=Vitis vinifera TaxID=29760 RepID=UPI00053FA8F3|nr:rust resistance kinase Lr10 [Vitis vinifera]|eukprot:XP_010645761.1 PREDICTED: rust resistance kinase Lr10-like [Vitis vinifera]
MCTSLKLVLSLSCFLFVGIFAEVDECKVSRCSPNGPAIRFPFWLRDHQPAHCGFPGFELSCTEKHQTMLNLSHSVKLLVKKINYKSQEIQVHDTDDCRLTQFSNLSLHVSPFQLQEESQGHFSLLNCTSTKTAYSDYFYPVPCLSAPAYQVYAVYSSYSIDFELSSCRKIHNVSLPDHILMQDNIFPLNWDKPMCKSCEAEGGKCRWKKSNSKEPETQCVKGASKKPMVTGITLGSILLIIGTVALHRVYSWKKLERNNQIKIEKFLEDYIALKPTRYSYADIKKITNHFQDKLGEGGYGTVYKGKLSDEVHVAVKILNNTNGNGEEFLNEVGTMGRIHHVNVVRLVGFCADGFRRALIYEFLPNESLEKFIFSRTIKNHSLGWKKLQDIALGIAKGIEYLHQGCDQRILHFDIKPHNILLDHNFNPKIADFGLAKLCSKEQSAVSMTTARGTMGYIAPEMLSRNLGNVSYKSDVFSYGMLLLEMVGGRKNIDVTVDNTSQVYFPEWIYNHLDQGEELQIRIDEEGDTQIVKKLTIIGLWCIQWFPTDRPSMKLVVQMLEGEHNLSTPPNPFTCTTPTKTNASTSKRYLQQELTVISEIE